jgi:cytidine deaminase
MIIDSLSEIEKKCILRFLYEIAQSDYKVVEEELCTIKNIAREMGVKTNCSEKWLMEEWTPNNDKRLFDLIEKNCDISGLITGWCMEVMNADNIKHHNEQFAIIQFIQNSLGNPKYPKAKMVQVAEFDDVMLEMVEKTPEICIKKGNWWQKKKKNAPLKRVGASLSYQKNGKKKYVTAVNYELSMPGGSRCAEQNAIGMAIAMEPDLEFHEIKEVFIFGSGGLSNPCWPCGVCMENLRKLDKENQISLYAYPGNYDYRSGELPESMLKFSISDLTQRNEK